MIWLVLFVFFTIGLVAGWFIVQRQDDEMDEFFKMLRRNGWREIK